MALKSYRYKANKSTGVANIVIACGILLTGIVASARGEIQGSRWFLALWIGVFVVIIASFARTTFSKRGGTRVLLPGGRKDRWSGSETARTLGTFEPEDDNRHQN